MQITSTKIPNRHFPGRVNMFIRLQTLKLKRLGIYK